MQTRRRRGGGSGSNRNFRAVLTYERLNPNRYTYRVPGNTKPLESRIAAFLRSQPPLRQDMLVWRGQWNFPLNADSWFSTSTKDTISRSYGGRNLFKIHLMPGVHCADLYDYYASLGTNLVTEGKAMNLNMSNNYTQFGEVIVEGHGEFWQDAEKSEPGFRFVGYVHPTDPSGKEDRKSTMNVYETYYFV
jgi:hypothetical protein